MVNILPLCIRKPPEESLQNVSVLKENGLHPVNLEVCPRCRQESGLSLRESQYREWLTIQVIELELSQQSHQSLSPNSGTDVGTQKENGRACPQDGTATVATSSSENADKESNATMEHACPQTIAVTETPTPEATFTRTPTSETPDLVASEIASRDEATDLTQLFGRS